MLSGNTIVNIDEGEHEKGFINAAVYRLTKDYFEYPMTAIKEGKEYGLPQSIMTMISEHAITAIEATNWRQVSTMEDVESLSLDYLLS